MTTITLDLSYRNPITDALESNPLAPTGSWRIAAPYRADETLPMVAVHPRPDLAHADAAWRWFTTKVDNEIRLVWQGGEPPYRIEMTVSPTGATIGESGTVQEFVRTVDAVVPTLYRHTLPEAYATVRMPAASVTDLATYDFEITVTGQNDEDVITFDFSVTANDSKHRFFDSVNGNNANAGTFEAPFQTFLHGYTLSGRAALIYMYKNGTYSITNGSGTYADISDTRSRSHIGIGTNASSVIFDMSSGGFSGAVSDFTAKKMTVTGLVPYLTDNPKQFRFSGQSRRAHFQNVRISPQVGTSGADNPCGIFFTDLGAGTGFYHTHISIVDCVLLSTSTASLVVYFGEEYAVEENCTTEPGIVFPQVDGSLVSHRKSRSRNTTYRFCNYTADSGNGIIWISNQDAAECVNSEIVYCRFENVGAGNSAVVRFNGQALVGTLPSGQSAVRCSIVAGDTGPFNFESFISGPDVGYGGILWSANSSSPIDSSGGVALATSSVRVANVDTLIEANLGIRGCVIASTEVV